MKMFIYIFLGLTAGTLSGLFGIGGGTILIPGLVFLAGMTQHEAQGTTLAIMLLPIGLLAVIKYHQANHINFWISGLICAGFFIGGYIGAYFAQGISEPILKKAFGGFLFLVAINMIFSK